MLIPYGWRERAAFATPGAQGRMDQRAAEYLPRDHSIRGPNPQRRRRNPQSPPPGTVDPRTGKPYLSPGYAPTTINHALSVVSGFSTFHAHYGRGPVAIPVPASPRRLPAGLRAPFPIRALAEVHPGFKGLKFTPHDFRRILITELVNSGLAIHIGAALLGHLNVQSTRRCIVVFDEDIIRHYQEHLEHRRQIRPTGEYRDTTSDERDAGRGRRLDR
ncbi:site-specific integrase [Streptomyces sp. NRRL WC-3725]|uniref:site-specific integrase n=1 Tax=Streptomyces sp. NRRL WC-3725 TaxID=1463933 RepID=UPI0019001698|nr:site-specific integrase [Streptomyces sp. NRRL WC-3725]